jgi:hypothetical protein
VVVDGAVYVVTKGRRVGLWELVVVAIDRAVHANHYCLPTRLRIGGFVASSRAAAGTWSLAERANNLPGMGASV